jgi:Ca2+/Na+ antiporter
MINTCLGRGNSLDDCITGLIASSAGQSSVQEASDSATTPVPPVNVLLSAIIILACIGVCVVLISAKRRGRRGKR